MDSNSILIGALIVLIAIFITVCSFGMGNYHSEVDISRNCKNYHSFMIGEQKYSCQEIK